MPPPPSRQLALHLSELPRGLRPMQGLPLTAPFDAPQWLFDGFWGGLRALAYVERGRGRLVSLSGRDITAAFSDAAQAVVDAVAVDGVVLDGELVVRDSHDAASLPLAVRRLLSRGAGHRRPATFYAWDILYHGFRPVLPAPLVRRKELLAQTVAVTQHVKVSLSQEANGIAVSEAATLLGMDGVIARRARSLYTPGRRDPRWLFIRGRHTAELVVGGYTVGPGRRRPVNSLLLGAYAGSALRYMGTAAGSFGSGGSAVLGQQLAPLQRPAPPFAGPPEVRELYYWCEPRLAVQVDYGELGRDGRLRFPVFVALRPDVDPADCTTEALRGAKTPVR